MIKRQILLAIALISHGAQVWAGDFYFGGYGDIKHQWTGYSVKQTKSGLTNWIAYTLAEPGKITIAPATFHQNHTNTWSAIFDEHVFGTNGTGYGLSAHNLTVRNIQEGRAITLQDGQTNVTLKILSETELSRIQNGSPNQAMHQQPVAGK